MNYATAEAELRASMDTPFHKVLHTPEIGQEQIFSRFFDPETKSAWYSPDFFLDLACKELEDEQDIFTFSVPDSLSYLQAVFLVQTLPEIKVNEKFVDTIRAAWSPNMAYAVVEEGVQNIGDHQPRPINRHYTAIFFQYNTPFELRADHEYCIGNRPELIEYSTHIRSTQVGCAQPFYFYRIQNQGHIVKLSKNSFTYTILRDVKRLLRIQTLVNGVWTQLQYQDFNPEWFVKDELSLPRPKLYGVGTYNTIHEMATQRAKPNGTMEVYFTDVTWLASTNPTNSRELHTIKDKHPVKAIFTVAENVTATKQNYYCNYTSDPQNHIKGRDPWKFTEITYDGKRRMRDLTSGIMSKLVPMEVFRKSLPWCSGFHAAPLCFDPWDKQNSGVVIGHDTLAAHLNLELDSYRGDTGPYIVHTFLLIQRKLVYKADENGEHSVIIV